MSAQVSQLLRSAVAALRHPNAQYREAAANTLSKMRQRAVGRICLERRTFTEFMTDLNKIIFDYVSSNVRHEKLGGIPTRR